MNLDINFGIVLQGLIAAALVGAVRVGWQTSITLTKLSAAFDAHVKLDEAFQERIENEIQNQPTRRRKKA